MNGNLLVMGASTGGPRVLEELFSSLPVLQAAIVIVQHITPCIDKAFAGSLGRVSRMPVNLARDGDLLQDGQVYLAPGGVHLSLVNNRRVHLTAGERVNSVCPSIDVTMKTVEPTAGNLAGVILSGMGRDGADGIAHVRNVGGLTIAQDQATSVIYGMPKAAVETGKIQYVLSTNEIARKLKDIFS